MVGRLSWAHRVIENKPMRSLLYLPLLLVALAPEPARPLPVSAHNCYPIDRSDNPRLVEALALGIDNIELDLGWDAEKKQLIVGHDAEPRPGVAYPGFEATLIPALEAHWKEHPPGKNVAPTVLTIDFKTDSPQAVARFKAFLDDHPDWFSTAPKADVSPLTERRLTVSLTGSEPAKDAYDALVPPSGTYRAFRDRVHGMGAKYEDDVAAYIPAQATPYHRFLTFHWMAIEKGGPALANDWTEAESGRLSSLMRLAHDRGFRVRIYCLNGQTGNLLSGYRFPSALAARIRWLAAARAGVDWIASDEYREIVAALSDSERCLLRGERRSGTDHRPRFSSSAVIVFARSWAIV